MVTASIVINYHHVIHALRRKPQALLELVYRDSLFPRTEYADAWKALQRDLPRRDACRRMVDLLFSPMTRPARRNWQHLLAEDLDAGRLPDADTLSVRLEPRGTTALPDDVAVALTRAGQLRRPAGDAPMTALTAREIDIHALPSMLTALRLPSFHKLWPEIAERADTEGWPAARFLAALAEYELAERDIRRIRRHLNEFPPPGGKTLATFDFKALPTLPRARVEALAAGDWIETGVAT